MKSATETQEDLQAAFDELKTGKLDVGIATELHNNVGKQMGLVKLQLEYATLRGEKPEVEFLDKTEVKV